MLCEEVFVGRGVVGGGDGRGGAWVAGVWVEQELRDKLQWEPDSVSPDINFAWEEYQRGYLESTAKLRFDIGGAVHRYVLKIHHAPLLQTETDIARMTIFAFG